APSDPRRLSAACRAGDCTGEGQQRWTPEPARTPSKPDAVQDSRSGPTSTSVSPQNGWGTVRRGGAARRRSAPGRRSGRAASRRSRHPLLLHLPLLLPLRRNGETHALQVPIDALGRDLEGVGDTDHSEAFFIKALNLVRFRLASHSVLRQVATYRRNLHSKLPLVNSFDILHRPRDT